MCNYAIFLITAGVSLPRTLRQSDVNMWSALEAVQMKGYVQSLLGGLDAPVAEGGGNLSVSGLPQRSERARITCRLTDSIHWLAPSYGVGLLGPIFAFFCTHCWFFLNYPFRFVLSTLLGVYGVRAT